MLTSGAFYYFYFNIWNILLLGTNNVRGREIDQAPPCVGALINILALPAIRCELVTRRTDTLPGPGRVLTDSTTTQSGLSLALVDVPADLDDWRLLISLVTVTGEAALHIPTLAMTTNTRGDTTLVNVRTAENNNFQMQLHSWSSGVRVK